jgi:2-polyprenyl-6-methoxyphenol hydroxylase-like FAD-dependent oxidoreductase
MRALVVGGGVAGLTLAAKLRQQGREPVVVERAAEYGEHGYSLGLYPFGSSVLHGLGAYESLVARGMEMRTYEMADHTGEIVSSVELSEAMAEFGPSYVTTHADLVEVLREACGDLEIRMGTTVEGIEEAGDEVRAILSGGSEERFDVVCGCDGIHSWIREEVFGEQPTFDTDWVGWTWWGREGIFPAEVVREYWLRGGFFGTYPVPGKSTFVAAVPKEAIRPDPDVAEDHVLAQLRERFGDLAERSDEVGAALAEARDLWPWPLADVRAAELRRGRVVLCGDAGIAFLPTAGIGASTAMRSAAALADELSRADARLVPLALDHYAARVRPTAEQNQSDSRKLAKVMFIENRMASWGRDEIVKHMPASSTSKQIVEAMRRPM